MRPLRAAALLVALARTAAPCAAQQSAAPDALQLAIDSLRRDPNGLALARGDVTAGGRTVAAKEHVGGTVASWRGPLEIHGLVDGNAVALGGDVIVGKGGRVRGDAVSVGGTVRLDGGTVDGETRALSAVTIGVARGPVRTAGQMVRNSIFLSVGWFLLLACVGLFALAVARTPLDAVADAVREQTVRAFAVGVVGQLALAPVLALGTIGLAITIIGIIVIPFAWVAFLLALFGAGALGFVAVAMLTGQALSGGRNGDHSFAGALQPLFLGLTLFLLMWVAGSGLGSPGALGAGLRMTASFLTWVALTTGFGAVIITRAGKRPGVPSAQIAPAPTAEHEWQTPTPVTGVAAARRPTPAPRRGAGGP